MVNNTVKQSLTFSLLLTFISAQIPLTVEAGSQILMPTTSSSFANINAASSEDERFYRENGDFSDYPTNFIYELVGKTDFEAFARDSFLFFESGALKTNASTEVAIKNATDDRYREPIYPALFVHKHHVVGLKTNGEKVRHEITADDLGGGRHTVSDKVDTAVDELILAKRMMGNHIHYGEMNSQLLVDQSRGDGFATSEKYLTRYMAAKLEEAATLYKLDKDLRESNRYLNALLNGTRPGLYPYVESSLRPRIAKLEAQIQQHLALYNAAAMASYVYEFKNLQQWHVNATNDVCAISDRQVEQVGLRIDINNARRNLKKLKADGKGSSPEANKIRSSLDTLYRKSAERVIGKVFSLDSDLRALNKQIVDGRNIANQFERASIMERLVRFQNWTKDLLPNLNDLNSKKSLQADVKSFNQLALKMDKNFSICTDVKVDPIPVVEGSGLVQMAQSFKQPSAQSVAKKTNILFVEDTSTSLNDERAAISTGISKFIRTLNQNADVQIGVLLGHADAKDSGVLFRAGSEPAVLSTTKMSVSDMSSAFAAKMATVVNEDDTDGGEALMLSLNAAINKWRAGDTQGFFRSDAALSIIFITDENDLCSRSVEDQGIILAKDDSGHEIAGYEKYCFDDKGKLLFSPRSLFANVVKANGKMPVSIGGMVYTGHNPIPTGNEDEPAYWINEMIEHANGFFVDLGDPGTDSNPNAPRASRIAAGLNKLGSMFTETLKLNTRFTLSMAGVKRIDEVSVDGKDIDDYDFDSETNAIHIGVDSAGGANSVVKIVYHYAK